MSRPVPQSAPSGLPRLLAWIVVPGDPTTKSRARVVQRGGKTHAYTPRKTEEAEIAIRWYLRAARVRRDDDHELRVTLSFRTATRQRRDLDNLVKLVLDACNGIAWGDDFQVAEIHSVVERGHSEPGFDLAIEAIRSLARKCERCGKRLKRTPSMQARFCSRECYDATQRKGTERPCSNCGKPCYVQRIRPPAANHYCSDSCRSAFLKGKPRGGGPTTHCMHGHEWTPENTYVAPGTRTRICRECRRINQRRVRERKEIEATLGAGRVVQGA